MMNAPANIKFCSCIVMVAWIVRGRVSVYYGYCLALSCCCSLQSAQYRYTLFCLNYSSVNLSNTIHIRGSEHWPDVCLLLARLLSLPTRKQRRHFQNPQPDLVLCYSWFKTVELYFILTYTPTFKSINAITVQLYVLYVRKHVSKIYSRLVC
jgi:hypothetical protein